MASEWLESDKLGGLLEVAILRQDFWSATTAAGRLAASKEIRLKEVAFGLSPIDRRRLQWTIDQGEQAEEHTEARRKRKAADRQVAKDPRSVLKAVS